MDLTPYIDNPRLLNRETLVDLRRLTEEYPFYQAARLLYVQNLFLLHDSAFGEQMRRASVLIPDRSVLFHLAEEENFAPVADTRRASRSPILTENEDRTTSLIDGFLSDIHTDTPDGEASPHSIPTAADVTNDYASFLAQQLSAEEDEAEKCPAATAVAPAQATQASDSAKDSSDTQESNTKESNTPGRTDMSTLIDNFLDSTKGKQRYELPAESASAYVPTETPLTDPSDTTEAIYNEKIVHMLLQQGHYEQALDILKRICLKNPGKSLNFATQISLLEVIVGQQNGRKETAKQ